MGDSDAIEFVFVKFVSANMVFENMISDATEFLFGYFLDHVGCNVGTRNGFWHKLSAKVWQNISSIPQKVK